MSLVTCQALSVLPDPKYPDDPSRVLTTAHGTQYIHTPVIRYDPSVESPTEPIKKGVDSLLSHAGATTEVARPPLFSAFDHQNQPETSLIATNWTDNNTLYRISVCTYSPAATATTDTTNVQSLNELMAQKVIGGRKSIWRSLVRPDKDAVVTAHNAEQKAYDKFLDCQGERWEPDEYTDQAGPSTQKDMATTVTAGPSKFAEEGQNSDNDSVDTYVDPGPVGYVRIPQEAMEDLIGFSHQQMMRSNPDPRSIRQLRTEDDKHCLIQLDGLGQSASAGTGRGTVRRQVCRQAHDECLLGDQPITGGKEHTHEHSHAHDHGHDHSHGHGHSHDHSHDHSHKHSHEHRHSHDHAHAPAHSHTHEHPHRHSHGRDSHEHHRSASPYAETLWGGSTSNLLPPSRTGTDLSLLPRDTGSTIVGGAGTSRTGTGTASGGWLSHALSSIAGTAARLNPANLRPRDTYVPLHPNATVADFEIGSDLELDDLEQEERRELESLGLLHDHEHDD